MITRAFYVTLRKHGNLIFESSTSSTSDETHALDSDIELRFDSDSDDSNSQIYSNDPQQKILSQQDKK